MLIVAVGAALALSLPTRKTDVNKKEVMAIKYCYSFLIIAKTIPFWQKNLAVLSRYIIDP